jgi:two-component system nitrate/nitrite response regulator NarL
MPSCAVPLPKGEMMRLVFCDDNRILCDALATALEAHGHEALAITTSPAEGIVAVGELQPDACLMDLRFPNGDDGLRAARALRERYPQTAVLVLSAQTDAETSNAAREIGVAGFLAKDQNIDQIADALELIASGGQVFRSPPCRPETPRRGNARDTPALAALTEREQEVLRRIAAGQGTAQMASEMTITIGTLRTYVRNVLAKLGAHSRLEAAALISRQGMPGDQ